MIAWYWAVVIAVVASGMGLFAGCLISARSVREAEAQYGFSEERAYWAHYRLALLREALDKEKARAELAEYQRDQLMETIADRTDQAKGE